MTALLLVSASLGTIHAFSVLVEPLESRLGAGRGDVSLAYSIALASLTVAVTVGHRIYTRASPAVLMALACVGAAVGLLIAAATDSLLGLWLGYGLIFGFANGVGYGLALHLANQWFGRRRGRAMGSVTAIYAVGAGAAAFAIEPLAESGGARRPLLVLAGLLVAVGLVAVVSLPSGVSLTSGVNSSGRHLHPADLPAGDRAAPAEQDQPRVGLAWLTYGTAVAAGLMAMGHAASIVTEKGGSSSDGVRGAFVIVVVNACAGFVAGSMADRYRPGLLLAGLGVISAIGLGALALFDGVGLAFGALALVGLGYGATISIFPILTTQLFGIDMYVRAYGRIFTSWGLAGLSAPWFAGVLFVRAGNYTAPLLVAAALALVSAALSVRLSTESFS